MATLTVQTSDSDGLIPTYNSVAAGGDQFRNTGDVVLYIKNVNAATRTVTVTAQTSSVDIPRFGTVAIADAAVTVSATTGEQFLGPFPAAVFNDGSNNAQITYSAATGLTVAVIKVIKTP